MQDTLTEQEKRTLERIHALKDSGYNRHCDEILTLHNAGNVRMWNYAHSPQTRPKEPKPPEPAAPRQRVLDWIMKK
jgi:hypothetical protein